jgi:hypothetical protein
MFSMVNFVFVTFSETQLEEELEEGVVEKFSSNHIMWYCISATAFALKMENVT